MPQPLVSIIVPIYKVEPYLRRCLNSIVNQTYTNLEIILVDDGSPDGCPQICDEYAAKDKRIVVIHKKNGGLSDARNAGLDICKGEYISFVDSDDWVADVYIEALLNSVSENNADMAIANFLRTNQFYKLSIPNYDEVKAQILQPVQAVKKLWTTEEIIFVTAWAKLAKTSLYNNIRFPKGLIHEDEYTSYKLLYESSKTVFLDIPLYCYFQREDSIMGEAKPSSIRVLKARVERYQYFKQNNEKEIMGLCLKNLCWDLIFAYGQRKIKKLSIGYSAEEIINIYRTAVEDFHKSIYNNFKKYVILKIFALYPQLYLIYQVISPIKLRKI